jgi:tripartite ATP-independent transporter DctP family solute receptor
MIILLTAALVFTGCGSNKPAQTEQKALVLKLAEVHPPDYPTTIGDKEFAKIVGEKTNGRIKIEVYPGGQLGDEKSVIEAVQMGGIAATRVSSQPLAEFQKKLGVLSLPYLFDSEQHLWKVLNGPIGEELLDTLKDSKMIGLTYYDSGARSFYNSKREVKTPADMKGLKIRVQQAQLMVGLVESLGASATPMAYGEVYSGLQTGVIDGAENNWPSYYSTSHYEVAKYITLDEHVRNPEILLMSKAVWDKIGDADKKIIKEAAVASQKVQIEAWKTYEKKSIDAIKAKGNVITEVKDVKAWQDAVKPVYDKYAGDWKDIIAKIRATK